MRVSAAIKNFAFLRQLAREEVSVGLEAESKRVSAAVRVLQNADTGTDGFSLVRVLGAFEGCADLWCRSHVQITSAMAGARGFSAGAEVCQPRSARPR